MSSKPQKPDKKGHLFSKSRAYRGEMSFCLCYSFLSAVCSVVFKPVFRLEPFKTDSLPEKNESNLNEAVVSTARL